MSTLSIFDPPLLPIDESTPKDRPILGYGPYGWDLQKEHCDDPKRADIGFAVIQFDPDWWEESDTDENNGLIQTGRWVLITGNPYTSRMFPTAYLELPNPIKES